MPLQIGQMLSRYRACDQRLNRDLAVKVLRHGLLESPVSRKRFRNEALMLSKLNHPVIQIIHDFDEIDGTDFLVSELVSGVFIPAPRAFGGVNRSEYAYPRITTQRNIYRVWLTQFPGVVS
ncbi:MAG: hypothetical protein WBL50_01530 [Candidatus Acidiferrum sp.]